MTGRRSVDSDEVTPASLRLTARIAGRMGAPEGILAELERAARALERAERIERAARAHCDAGLHVDPSGETGQRTFVDLQVALSEMRP